MDLGNGANNQTSVVFTPHQTRLLAILLDPLQLAKSIYAWDRNITGFQGMITNTN